MCGVVAVVGKHNATQLVIEGLRKLEYRGYDSAGIASMSNGTLRTTKSEGKLYKLIDKSNEISNEKIHFDNSIAIGHTRWATHGKVILENTHPIISENIAVVHNGIIENHEKIRLELKEKNVVFETTTDTEVIPHLLNITMKNTKNFFDACIKERCLQPIKRK